MFITRLPKIHPHFVPIFIPPPSLLSLHLFLFSPKPHITFSLLSTPKTNPISHFSSTPSLPTPTDLQTPSEEETHIQIPIEKLFVPPDTEVPSGNSPLSTRILKGSNIVLSKYARDAQVVQAEFVKSSVRTEDCPPSDGIPEFALVGRSNVGKSSLLNSLVRRKKLALTSKKPVKNCWHHAMMFYELSSYEVWLSNQMVMNLQHMHQHGTDASIPAKPIDLEYASWLGQNQIPMTLIFTKCDKRKKKKNGGKRPEENVQDFQELIRDFFQTVPPWIMTSSVTNQGRDEILLHMAQLRNYWLKH
ncbi:hypothetical protein RHGRI_020785 [Rhododendron griersonianum]|uniref:G domain-containing protein n=1 Tax=Rhododendron griersonianum TaxID=479676 RepID=A0AAV6JHI8_9ERIC|nr:hypothetical protein RHGRI_020785 [Rhododendron griersonianum]